MRTDVRVVRFQGHPGRLLHILEGCIGECVYSPEARTPARIVRMRTTRHLCLYLCLCKGLVTSPRVLTYPHARDLSKDGSTDPRPNVDYPRARTLTTPDSHDGTTEPFLVVLWNAHTHTLEREVKGGCARMSF